LGTKLTVTIPTDERGYMGRECPVCELYFKVMLGTGIAGPAPCFCAYCGHESQPDQFLTKDQVEFVKAAAFRYAHNEIFKMLKRHEGPIGRQDGFIKMSLKVEPGAPPPVFRYRERDLESELTCSNCTLQYTIYGVFAYCPDCGQHNSEQILNKNLDTVEKMLTIADEQEADLKQQIIEDALENSVSAFDGFGREYLRVRRMKSGVTDDPYSFQNIVKARERLLTEYNLDFGADLAAEEWSAVVRSFHKRHLLAHSVGIVDQAYLRATKDSAAVEGRKIRIERTEVSTLIAALRKIARRMAGQVAETQS